MTFLAVCVYLATAAVGCGYTTSSCVLAGASTIFVDNFANDINVTKEVDDQRMYQGYKSGMELDITRQIIDRFVVDGTLDIRREENADIILTGALVDFREDALRYDSSDNVTEFRIKVSVNMKLTERKTGEIVLSEQGFTGESIYRTIGEFAESEDAAIQDAVKDLARRVVERIVEGW